MSLVYNEWNPERIGHTAHYKRSDVRNQTSVHFVTLPNSNCCLLTTFFF